MFPGLASRGLGNVRLAGAEKADEPRRAKCEVDGLLSFAARSMERTERNPKRRLPESLK